MIFRNTALEETVQALELQDMVLETDAPYQSPPQVPRHKNHPRNVFKIARYVAELKNVPVRVVIDATRHTAERLFRI